MGRCARDPRRCTGNESPRPKSSRRPNLQAPQPTSRIRERPSPSSKRRWQAQETPRGVPTPGMRSRGTAQDQPGGPGRSQARNEARPGPQPAAERRRTPKRLEYHPDAPLSLEQTSTWQARRIRRPPRFPKPAEQKSKPRASGRCPLSILSRQALLPRRPKPTRPTRPHAAPAAREVCTDPTRTGAWPGRYLRTEEDQKKKESSNPLPRSLASFHALPSFAGRLSQGPSHGPHGAVNPHLHSSFRDSQNRGRLSDGKPGSLCQKQRLLPRSRQLFESAPKIRVALVPPGLQCWKLPQQGFSIPHLRPSPAAPSRVLGHMPCNGIKPRKHGAAVCISMANFVDPQESLLEQILCQRPVPDHRKEVRD